MRLTAEGAENAEECNRQDEIPKHACRWQLENAETSDAQTPFSAFSAPSAVKNLSLHGQFNPNATRFMPCFSSFTLKLMSSPSLLSVIRR